MFYLKEFFKSLGESLFRGFFFFLFSCLLAFSLTHRPWIANTISKISPEKMTNPYFVAVIDGSVDAERVKNSIGKLPGVININDKETERSKSKIASLINSLGADYSLNSEMLNFKSLRIVLSPALSGESLNFVREQVLSAGGKEHVTASEIKYPEVAGIMKTHPFYSFLSQTGDWGVVGIIALLWITSYWLCYDVFRSRSYIIEKFQRKKLVASKSIATGLSVVTLAFASLGVLNGTLKFFDLIILLMVFSVFWTFSLQDWRWKSNL